MAARGRALLTMACWALSACRGDPVPPPPAARDPAAPGASAALTASVTATPTDPDPAARARLRDAARVVLERHCGDCHVPDAPTALAGALAVYDLRAEEWAATMTDAQLAQLTERIRQGALFDEMDERNRGRSPPPDPSAEEQAIVRDYVRAEQARRRAAADGRGR